MAGADRHTRSVEDCADVVGVNAGDVEAHGATAPVEVLGPIHLDALRLLE